MILVFASFFSFGFCYCFCFSLLLLEDYLPGEDRKEEGRYSYLCSLLLFLFCFVCLQLFIALSSEKGEFGGRGEGGCGYSCISLAFTCLFLFSFDFVIGRCDIVTNYIRLLQKISQNRSDTSSATTSHKQHIIKKE